MKRLLLYATATVVLMLVSNGVLGAQSTVAPLSTLDLANITAGSCSTCGTGPSQPQPPAPEPRVIASEWRIIRQTNTSPKQLNYSIIGEWRNTNPKSYDVEKRFSDNCRRQLTSGGIGISTSLNISVGTTIHCSESTTLKFTVQPRSTVKLYQANMRYFSEYEAAVVAIWNNGREEVTSRRDYGVEKHDYTLYHPIHNRY